MQIRFAAVLFSLALATPFVVMRAQPAPVADPLATVVNALTFRNIGPFRTAAWVTDIAVPDSPAHDHLYTIYAATRSGGRATAVAPLNIGDYTVTVDEAGQSFTKPARVRARL